MREFVSAGGELIIHGAILPKNSPTPQLVAYLPFESPILNLLYSVKHAERCGGMHNDLCRSA